jgi:hypothetical protein
MGGRKFYRRDTHDNAWSFSIRCIAHFRYFDSVRPYAHRMLNLKTIGLYDDEPIINAGSGACAECD